MVSNINLYFWDTNRNNLFRIGARVTQGNILKWQEATTITSR